MIRPLRRRHRSMILALTLILPVLFVAGLMVRRPVPPTVDPGVEEEASSYEELEVIGRDERAWGELPIVTIWLRTSGAGTRRAVTLELAGPLKRPDLLVYWDDLPGDDGEMSEGARLLGRLGGRRRVTWDLLAPSASGRLVLYSPAWKQLVGSAAPPADWGTPR